MQRRHLLTLAATLALSAPAFAQTAAEKALAADKFTLVAPFPPGGPIDTLARILAEGLGKRYGQVALVDNAPGAAGNIGMDKVKKAKPDGHTLLVIPAGNLTINPTLMPKFPFNVDKDFVPVAMLAKTPNVLVTHPGTGLKTVTDLIKAAKAKPDTLSYASPGSVNVYNWADYIGETTIEDFANETGIDIVYDLYASAEEMEAKMLAGSSGYDVVLQSGLGLHRLVAANLYQKIDRARLQGWDTLNPEILKILQGFDPENSHGVPYTWGTVGFTFNVPLVRERLPDVDLTTLDAVFLPENAAKLAMLAAISRNPAAPAADTSSPDASTPGRPSPHRRTSPSRVPRSSFASSL